MQFQISTPQTVGADIAMKEARKACRRRAAHNSDIEPSAKKQKLPHGSTSLTPTPTPAPAHFQTHGITPFGPTPEVPKLTDSSLPPARAQSQTHNTIDHGPASAATKKRKPDGSFVDLTPFQDTSYGSMHPARAPIQNVTDPEPATKKQKLSYANLPSARVQRKVSSEEFSRIHARDWRKRLESECRRLGHDHHVLDQIPDEILTSDNFDVSKHMLAIGSNNQSIAYGAPQLDVSPSSAESLKPETREINASYAPNQNIHNPSYCPPSPDTATQVRPVSGQAFLHCTPASSQISKGRLDSGDKAPHCQSVQNASASHFSGKLNEARSSPSYQSSPVNSILQNPAHEFPDNKAGNSTSNESSIGDVADHTAAAISSQNVSLTSKCDIGPTTAAANLDEASLRSPGLVLTDNTTDTSFSRTPSVRPPRNLGGRPRGRKPPAAKIPKTPKGPMRFQKNRPVKAAVNVDVWENILSFCPPDFLLQAREISSTFRSVLKADSHIWKTSRVSHFGHDMPDPPSGLSEPQYIDLLTGTGCQARGCGDKKARKTYWAFQKRLCMKCFQQAFLPPRALRRVFKELETSAMPQYRSIAQHYQSMEEFLPGMKFDRWDNYQWLGDYDPTPSWGQVYRSGQYVAFPASAYATFSSELAELVGNEYDVEQGRFASSKPIYGKTCPPQDVIDAWFDSKRIINDALVPELQAVENWCETYKRNNQKVGKDLRKSRESFYGEQAELANLDKSELGRYESYQAAIAISKPATMQSWKILLPKILAEMDSEKRVAAEREADAAAEMERCFESDLEREMETERTAEESNRVRGVRPVV